MHGIDYGMGQTNVDKETGIRYGVIHSSKLNPEAWEDILNSGEDLEFEAWRDEMTERAREAVNSAIGDYTICEAEDSHIQELLDSMGVFDHYESYGDSPRYLYEEEGYKIETLSDGDWFVLKSDFYTRCDFCSPCAPGAGYITSPCEDGVKTYCLGHDWFKGKAPYPVYRVSDDSLVTE